MHRGQDHCQDHDSHWWGLSPCISASAWPLAPLQTLLSAHPQCLNTLQGLGLVAARAVFQCDHLNELVLTLYTTQEQLFNNPIHLLPAEVKSLSWRFFWRGAWTDLQVWLVRKTFHDLYMRDVKNALYSPSRHRMNDILSTVHSVCFSQT